MNTMNPFLVFALAVMVIIAGYICMKVLERSHGDRHCVRFPKT